MLQSRLHLQQLKQLAEKKIITGIPACPSEAEIIIE